MLRQRTLLLAVLAACAMAAVVMVQRSAGGGASELASVASQDPHRLDPALKITDAEELHANRGDASYRPKIAVTFERARTKMLESQAKEQSAKLRHKAAVEDREASALVGAAKQLAQKMVQREAMNEMRHWIGQQKSRAAAARAPAPESMAARKAHLARAAVAAAPREQSATHSRQGGVHHHAKHNAKHHAMTDAERIRMRFHKWHGSALREYGDEHHLYSASEFCNTEEAQNAIPTVAQLRQAFGVDYKSVVKTSPELSQLAVVSSCLKALDSNAKKEEAAWRRPALKGKESLVLQCADGEQTACTELAKDPSALASLRKLLPPAVAKAVAGK